MRRLVRLVRCVSCATAVFALPGAAHAAASAHLVYVRGPGAEQCAGEQAVRAAVGARLGYDPFFAWAHETLFAEITRAEGAFLVELKLVDDLNNLRGARQIAVKGDDCAAAIDAMALTMSLTIDPSSVIGPLPPRAPAAPSTPPAQATELEQEGPSPPPRIPREASASDRAVPKERAAGHVGGGALGSVGAAPAVTVGATLFAGVSWRALSLDVEARADMPATGLSDSAPAQVRSWLLAGSVVPCLHLGAAFACLVASGGALGATSVGIATPRDAYGPWWAAGGRGGAEFALQGTMSVRTYAELLGTLTRDTLLIDHARAYTLAPWSGGFGVALAWRFP